MSRSIHTTHADVAALKKKAFASKAERERELKKAQFDLRRKRLAKENVLRERRDGSPVGVKTNASSVAIEVTDEGAYVHHGASAEDIRAVLSLLPPAASEGIACVRLSLGRHYCEDCRDDLGGEGDPITGRLGVRLFPGVFSGTVLGTFRPRAAVINLHAYVVDPERLTIPRPLCDLYLRLHALKTLVHEVAHFHDEISRVARGRWLSDRKENSEWYAEKMEQSWTTDIVLPFLERNHAGACRALRLWVRQRGGINLPLAFFAGDSRRTERSGLSRFVFSTAGAFECWLEELPRCSSLADSHLALARELHFADKYEECLAVLNTILGKHADHARARSWRADTLVHLERFDEALADADRVISADPADDRAWEARADVFASRRDWLQLLATCERWDSQTPKRRSRKRSELHHYRAIAFCALDRLLEMDASLAAYRNSIRFRSEDAANLRMAVIRRSVFRRAGKTPPADPLLDSRRRKLR